MKNKIKNTVIVTFSITLILIMLVGATYAYFTAQAGGTTSRNVSVTSNTTDNLSFQISNDISFTVTQADFYENAGNRDGYATATATLIPNNNTGAATEHYYLYLLLDSNPTEYSEENANEDAELLLQFFDSNNQQVTLTGLGSQVTVEDGLGNSLTGYDITGVEGRKVLLSNQTISASNNTTEVQTWRVVITLINYDFNQNDNTGKTITGRLEIRKDALPEYVYWNDNFSYSNEYASNAKPATTYPTLEALETGYGEINFADNPVYIRTTVVGTNATGHETCLLYNGTEFCMGADYWVETGNGDEYHYSAENQAATLAKLKSDLEDTFGITLYNSYEAAEAANSTYYCEDYGICHFDKFHVNAANDGSVIEVSGSADYCRVNSDGSAKCYYFD